MDTRGGVPTIDGRYVGGGPVGAGRSALLTVAGRGGVPVSGVGAVVVNVTVTQPTSGGFVTVWPAGQPRPNASSVNFAAGQTVANLVVVPLGGDGQISLFNYAGSAEFVVDVLGWLPGEPLPPSSSLSAISLRFEEVATVTAPSDLVSRTGSPLLYVAERGGTVRSVNPASGAVSEPLLDLSADLATDGERGLLGLAFSPDGARLFVSFNPADGNSGIDEFTMAGDAVDVVSRRPVIRVAQPDAGNHKGGHVAFGPDGLLWWGLGDGGGEGDPFGNGQRLDTLLGGMVRIDPTSRAQGGYSVPADNPWAAGGGAPEKWSLGKGANFGWPLREGTHESTAPAPAGAVDPIFEYSHGLDDANGCAITGGYVYRGRAIPELRGAYLYTDYCVSTLHGLRRSGGAIDAYDFGAQLRGDAIVSFGEGPDGEMYALSLDSGAIGRIARA